VLINNAGVARGKSILEATEKDIDLTFKVNTFSHYYLTQQFLPSMIMRNHGMIVTVASLTGFVTVPSMVDYSASKAASIAFHEGLSAELATHYKAPKVRTVLMCPGFTRTALLEGFGGTAMYPDTVAKGIVKAILGGKSKHLILPKSWWHIAPTMKGWPLWMQYSLRKGLADLVKGWRGRQVAQPSEVEGEKGVTDPIRV
jgi:short-subunit dehydrogenase